jgi:hypothetical protein
MSVYIDTITFIWAICLLFGYAHWAMAARTVLPVMGFWAISTYLIAQSGWTTAFLLGDVWGRDLSNYIWFVFNSLVLGILTMLWLKNEGK